MNFFKDDDMEIEVESGYEMGFLSEIKKKVPHSKRKFISIELANCLLEQRSMPVYGRADGGDVGWTERKKLPDENQSWNKRTHRALLIGIEVIEPIEPDTAEKILADLVHVDAPNGRLYPIPELIRRAKKVLGM